MKNKFRYSILLFILSVLFISCQDITTADVSHLTYYVNITLKGNSVMTVPLGGTFTDPGFTATENGTDVSSKVKVSGIVDANTTGAYTLTYSAVNKDGFPISVSRLVIVYDQTSASSIDISGTYTSNILRTDATSGAHLSHGPFTVTLKKIAQGVFSIDDLLGGWYAIGSGYGSSYAGSGYVALHTDNSISIISSTLPGWGDAIEFYQSSYYDPNTGNIYLFSNMASTPKYQFAVTLTK